MTTTPPHARPVNGPRAYQAAWSKQTMNESRYTPSGSTQSSGIAATSWQRRFVVETRRIEAMAGSPTQNSASPGSSRSAVPAGEAGISTGTSDADLHTRAAQIAHAVAKKANPIDQASACAARVSRGSTIAGYASSASSDPALERA